MSGLRFSLLAVFAAVCWHASLASGDDEDSSGESFDVGKISNLAQHINESLKRASTVSFCLVLVDETGVNVQFRCVDTILEQDTVVLLINNEVAGIVQGSQRHFQLSINSYHDSNNKTESSSSVYTVVVLDAEGEVTSHGSRKHTTYTHHRNSTCDLHAIPDYDLTAVVVPCIPKFYYIHFVNRGDNEGDKGESSPDWRGLCPHEIVHFFDTMLMRAASGGGGGNDNNSNNKAVVVDVGANKGSHACYPAAAGARVWAVEPYAFHARRLHYMAKINSWDMHVFCGGADEVVTERVIHDTGSNVEMRNVLQEPNKQILRSWSVQVTRLDEWVKEERKITMIKIDTDGHEVYALRGAVGLFKNPGVKYMKIEFIPFSLETAHPGEKDIALQMLMFLREHKFAIYYVPVGSHNTIVEWYCYDQLELLEVGRERQLVDALHAHRTPDFPWAMTNLMAVNLDDVHELPLDFPCLAL